MVGEAGGGGCGGEQEAAPGILILHHSSVIKDKISIICIEQCCGYGSGAFLAPGSGMGKKWKIRIRIRDEQPGSYFRELRTIFGLKKYLNSLMRPDLGSRMKKKIRIPDSGWKKFGSGINIPDPQHWY